MFASVLVAAMGQDPLLIQTTNGPVRGFIGQRNVRTWHAIPFAAPPVGQLRFAAPKPPTAWTSPITTTIPPSMCPQLQSIGGVVIGSEDCLYLSVYAPANASSLGPLPVFVWFYGGAWVFGDEYEIGLYDHTNRVAEIPHIAVSVNYRLSALGFLALDELYAEGASGNFAMLDQRLALQWVRDNAAAFGGDKTNVGIFGESAGGFSVCYHLASPQSWGLYSKAVMESGNCGFKGFFYTKAHAVDFGASYSTAVGCPDSGPTRLPCLRGLPLSEVLDGGALRRTGQQRAEAGGWMPKLYPFMPWGPPIDGTPAGLAAPPNVAFAAGRIPPGVVLMGGTNLDEGEIFTPFIPLVVPGFPVPVSRGQVAEILSFFFEFNTTVVDTIIDMYENDGWLWETVLNEILRDSFFGCSLRRALISFTAAGHKTWQYEFTYRPTWWDRAIFGDPHTAELMYVYNNSFPSDILRPWTDQDYTLSRVMQKYWWGTLAAGTPNAIPDPAAPIWAQFDPTNQVTAILDSPVVVQRYPRLDRCDFWDRVDMYDH